MASMTPLFPEPFGLEMKKVPFLEVNIELPDASDFFHMGGFELDHLRLPPGAKR
jgi:hypothetical protein